MCQLNVFCVSKNIEPSEVIRIFDKYEVFRDAKCIDENNLIPSLKDEFSFYIKGGYFCDCDSVVHSIPSEVAAESFEEYHRKKTQKELDLLYKARKIMFRDDYPEIKAAYKKKYDELDRVNLKLIREQERLRKELIDSVKNDETLTSEEKTYKLKHEIYPLITKMERDYATSQEYHDLVKKFADFFNEGDNRAIQESLYYTKEPFIPRKVKVCAIFPKEGEPSEWEEYEESKNIDDVIERTKRQEFKKQKEYEYESLIGFINDVRKIGGRVKIIAIEDFEDTDSISVDGEKEIALDSMTIDDLAFLPYNVLVSIV